ncbi:outer membrane protein assembly factor BamD [Desulfonema ishimotonii]|uniref:Outer membrane protein assembly factor BamD n=1 Tax=Desulfonema ishimotonii TaxID=45657 RepID=A0A401FRU7_9BACT|nr:outer membrane protein assembly factor BamD [Desulfonema ishimotonii]GBC59699.1 outer membrane protein assembly factor BamD [Desulfonema ishimotonii]
MRKIVFLCVIASLMLSGCALFQPRDEKSAEELVGDGMDSYETGKYRKAIESFENLKDWYPFSKYASLAELKIADAYFQLEEYQEAIFAYEEFESLHPRNEAIPYVIYQIGSCHFEQMDSVDRDQSVVQKALDTYNRIMRQFPDNTYAVKAGERIRECQKSLAGHEFYVGLFYYKNKKYKPALRRFEAVLSDYPDVGIHEQALRYITLCKQSIAAQHPEKGK